MVTEYFKVLLWHSAEEHEEEQSGQSVQCRKEYETAQSVEQNWIPSGQDISRHNRSNGTGYCQDRTSVSTVGKTESGRFRTEYFSVQSV